MKVHDLKPNPGSHKQAIRVGRGIGGKRGKTAGRGTKGQKARSKIRPGFEGGQMPLARRLPKLRGFNNPFRVEYRPVNLEKLNEVSETKITPELLCDKGLLRKGAFVKILGQGKITKKLDVSAHAFSKSARVAIEEAGGSVTVLPKPWGDRRPPAKGNALTNR